MAFVDGMLVDDWALEQEKRLGVAVSNGYAGDSMMTLDSWFDAFRISQAPRPAKWADLSSRAIWRGTTPSSNPAMAVDTVVVKNDSGSVTRWRYSPMDGLSEAGTFSSWGDLMADAGKGSFMEKLVPAAILAAAAWGASGPLFGGEAAAATASAETVPVGAMSMAGPYGGYSTTAALQSSTPLWLQPALAGGAAGGMTAAEVLKTGKTALDAVSLGAKLAGGGASSAAGASLVSPGGISLPKIGATNQGAAMLQQPAMPGASPGVFLPEDSGAVPLLPILAGLGLLLFLGR